MATRMDIGREGSEVDRRGL